MNGQRGQITATARRSAAIEDALVAGGPYLDPALVAGSRVVLDRAMARVELGSDHTVVALVGATGSGKSTLFNALAGMDIAEVGARRPMTRQPMAATWGEGGKSVLEWLGVPQERRMRRESVLDADRQAPLHGLILLDLPDHDSTEAIHQIEVDRLVSMVDLLVWVVDPQKYADDALHTRYLQQLTGHTGSMIVVLNQIDRLTPNEAQTCMLDLRRLLRGDGLEGVDQIAVSAVRGDGVDELRDKLAQVVQERGAVVDRVNADLQTVTGTIIAALGATEPGGGQPVGSEKLVDRLAAAAGVPAMVDALAAEYRRRGWLRIGWPVLTAVRRMRPAAGRLGATVNEYDLRVIATSLMPGAAPAQRAEVALAVDEVTQASSAGLPPRWAHALRTGAAQHGEALARELDDAVAGVSLQLTPPIWWRLVQVAQYLCAAMGIIGSAWLFVIGAAKLIGQDLASGPTPLVLFLVGLIGGAVLTAAAGWALAVGASHRRDGAEDRLFDEVDDVARRVVLAPIGTVLAAHRTARLALMAGPGGACAPPIPAAQTVVPAGAPARELARKGAVEDVPAQSRSGNHQPV